MVCYSFLSSDARALFVVVPTGTLKSFVRFLNLNVTHFAAEPVHLANLAIISVPRTVSSLCAKISNTNSLSSSEYAPCASLFSI